jgi:hypothetical protein
VRPAALAGQVLLDRFPKQTLVRPGRKNLIGELELLHALPFKILDFDRCHVTLACQLSVALLFDFGLSTFNLQLFDL